MYVRIMTGMMLLCLVSTSTMAATTVAPAAIVAPATTIAGSLVAQLVGNAPPGNITVVGVPAPTVVTTATQSGFVNNTAFGSLTVGITNTPVNFAAPGIILTNGNIIGPTNNLGPLAGDADVGLAVGAGANAVAALAATSDAASLSFSFTVALGMTSVSLDLIFATNEALGPVSAVRDGAVIIIDGTNFGKFANGNPLSNLDTLNIVPTPASGVITGFKNVSFVQNLVAPLNPLLATHTIKIAIADHVDSLRDSAILVSNMQATAALPPAAVAAGGSGVTITQGVSAGPAATHPADTIAPRLRRVGNRIINVMQNGLYLDQGAIAVDNIDGNLTAAIAVVNTVDTTIPAQYTITYNVSDVAGNAAAQVTRTVNVIATSLVDVLPPVVTAPSDILITATDFSGVANPLPVVDPRLQAFFNGVSANDGIVAGVPVPKTGAILNDAPVKFPIGKTLVTFTARDAQGNLGFAEATVTIVGSNQTKAGIDIDLDQIPDSWEIAVFGSLLIATSTPPVPPAVNPVITDFDADGLNDLVEWKLGTNPKIANSNPASISTDSWGAVFSNNPSDSDGDGVVDVLEDAASVTLASKVTGLPVSVSSPVKYSIQMTGGQALDRVHVDVTGAGAPANILPSFGVLSFRVNSGGVNIPVRITSSVPFGTSAQFYKVNAVGVYTLIPLTSINVVSSNTVDILLSDGGPLDLDAVAGTITDPIAIGSAPQILGGSGSSGGGCSIAQANGVDPLLPVLVLFALFYLIRSRKTSLRI